ncbi:MAG: hypothetical protein Q9227_007586 [Pyrenula ochraceoflavens]
MHRIAATFLLALASTSVAIPAPDNAAGGGGGQPAPAPTGGACRPAFMGLIADACNDNCANWKDGRYAPGTCVTQALPLGAIKSDLVYDKVYNPKTGTPPGDMTTVKPSATVSLYICNACDARPPPAPAQTSGH